MLFKTNVSICTYIQMLNTSDMDFLTCLKESVRKIKCYCVLKCPYWQLASFPSVEFGWHHLPTSIPNLFSQSFEARNTRN